MSLSTLPCPRCGNHPSAPLTEGVCAACAWALLLEDDAETAEPLEPATRRLGDYAVGDLIARGGMGAVYRARQFNLDREVALKVIDASATHDPDFVERFRIEAAAAASLVHPNIVSVYGFGNQDGEYYLAMQYISGGSLQHTATGQLREHMSPNEAAAMVAKVARAAHYAHQRGVLHRDLKPSNILIDQHGEPVLADFGMAKIAASDTAITVTSVVLGTPAYMSPEQARGDSRDVTSAADIYGLGAILYALLTGRPPVGGCTALETMRAVLEEEPRRPSALNPVVNRDLETICLKCLEKNPARRYASAAALADDLENFLLDLPIRARASGSWEWTRRWMRRNRIAAVIAVAAAVTLLTVTVVSLVMNVRLAAAHHLIAAQAEERRRELAALQVTTGTRLAEESDPLAATLAFAQAAKLDAGQPEKLLRDRERFAFAMANSPQLLRDLPHPAAVESLGFDPTGRILATACRDRKVRFWDVESGQLLRPQIDCDASPHWVGFSPTGRTLAVRTSAGNVTLYDAETKQPIFGPCQEKVDFSDRDDRGQRPVFSADGRRCVILRNLSVILLDLSQSPPQPTVLALDSQPASALLSPTGDRVVITYEKKHAELRELPDGKILYTSKEQVYERGGAWSPKGNRFALMQFTFSGRILTESAGGWSASVELLHGDAVLGCRFSPDGRRLLTWSYDRCARIFDSATGVLSASPLRHGGPVTAATFSPSGLTIATASLDGFVRILNPELETLGARLPLGGPVFDVAFSPDGRRLAAAANNGRVRLWRAPDGDLSTWHYNWKQHTNSLAYSPSGARLAAVALDTKVHIWDLPSGREACAPLAHPARAVEIGWSDEEHLVTTCADNQFRTWSIPEGIVQATIPMPPYQPARLSGRWLYMIPKAGYGEIWDATTGRRVFSLRQPYFYHPVAWSADLRRYLSLAPSEATIRSLPAPQNTLLVRPLNRAPQFGALDASGRLLAISYSDHSTEILSVDDGRKLAGPFPHQLSVRDMAFLPDGHSLVTASDDHTLRFWDMADGLPLSPPFQHGERVLRVSVRRDGRAVATVSTDGFVRVWEIPSVPGTPAELQQLAERLNAID